RDQDLVAPALALGAEAIHPEVSLLTQECVTQAHQARLRVNVWTANSGMRIRRLLKWGIDGIFSDYPERVVILRAVMRPDAIAGHASSLPVCVPVGKKMVDGKVEE
ncbi:MAG: glycerophosphodiester phosphodiesterase, partial [Ktedonobacterales bacterium]